METRTLRAWKDAWTGVPFALLLIVGALAARPLGATTVVPISDRDLYARADVVVQGIVVSSEAQGDRLGRPETVTVIEPLVVVKGSLSGSLVLHQLGGWLPDGRFFQMWGRPEYTPGHEVVVFAIARPEGDYQTAELLLGKFEVQKDEQGVEFAVPSLAAGGPSGVTVARPSSAKNAVGDDGSDASSGAGAPRELTLFLESLERPGAPALRRSVSPAGKLESIVHVDHAARRVEPLWDNIGALWRFNNGAAAAWTLQGQANITGGGAAEAANAAQTWDGEPNSTINYTIGTGGANPIHLDALSSPCGWSTCMSGGGVIGCGGPDGGGTNSWRGETYWTITGGEVWLRSYCSFNLWDSVTTQSVLTHELGHTLGLGHSDQGASPHDACRGDEDLATMRSMAQHRTSLGTDDSDAVRWLYGDGGNSCGGGGPTLTVARTGSGSGTVTSNPAGISCGSSCSFSFSEGTVVTLTATPSSGSLFTGWGGDADCADGAVTMSAARSCTATFEELADLVVSSVSVPSASLAGSTVSVSETTRNQGGAGAASVTRYYLSANSSYEAGDVPLGFRAVAALAGGTASSATLPLLIPANTAAGNYYIVARADADGQLAESNESNNTRAASIHVGPPDLIVNSFSVPSASGAGLTIRVTDSTRNQSGNGPAPASVTRFYLSTDSALDARDIPLGFRNVPALQPGDSSSASTTLTIPGATAGGNYFVIAKADADGLVTETSESNNTRADTIVIGPDLTVTVSGPSTGGAGLPVTVTDTTKNQGAGSTLLASTTSFYLSTNSSWSVGDIWIGSRTVGILLPGGSSSATTTFTIPASTAPGSYYIIAKADDGGVVSETDESNNTRGYSIKLSPDLIVSSLSVPVTAAPGAVISAGDTTKNQGQGTAAASTVRFYLSTNTGLDQLDVEIGSRTVALLTTGASSTGTTALTIPPGTTAGNYYVLARADADNVVAESSEGNNVTNKPITVSP